MRLTTPRRLARLLPVLALAAGLAACDISVGDGTFNVEKGVYGLTPAQTRLAALIVGGQGLVEAAGRLGVSVNTARTQLRRMFEKTGVNGQPALVRALLSVLSPLP